MSGEGKYYDPGLLPHERLEAEGEYFDDEELEEEEDEDEFGDEYDPVGGGGEDGFGYAEYERRQGPMSPGVPVPGPGGRRGG